MDPIEVKIGLNELNMIKNKVRVLEEQLEEGRRR